MTLPAENDVPGSGHHLTDECWYFCATTKRGARASSSVIGPVSSLDLLVFAADGIIHSRTLVRRNESSQWNLAEQVLAELGKLPGVKERVENQRQAQTSLARRHRRRRLAAAALLLLVTLLLASWYFVPDLFKTRQKASVPPPLDDDQRLQATIDKTNRLDPGWDWDDLESSRAHIPEKENAALAVLAAKKLLPRRWPTWRALDRSAGQELTFKEHLEFESTISGLPPWMQMNVQQTAVLLAELEEVSEALDEARRLTALPQGRYPRAKKPNDFFPSMPSLESVEPMRTVTILLGFDVLVRTQEGKLREALSSWRGMMNAGRSIGDEPGSLSVLFRVACVALALQKLERILAHGELPAAALKEAQQLLEDEQAQPLLLISVRGDRASADHLLKAIQTGDLPTEQLNRAEALQPVVSDFVAAAKQGDKQRIEKVLEQFRKAPQQQEDSTNSTDLSKWYHPSQIKVHRERVLRYHTRVVEICKLPDHLQSEPLANLGVPRREEPEILNALFPSIHGMTKSCPRIRAQLRCAATALAVERYRQVQGRWPESLLALAPDYLRTVPLDPYDGQPLRYRRSAEGVIIYSVGSDLLDQEGRVLNPGGESRNSGDLGFRLWDVTQRRQPFRQP